MSFKLVIVYVVHHNILEPLPIIANNKICVHAHLSFSNKKIKQLTQIKQNMIHINRFN